MMFRRYVLSPLLVVLLRKFEAYLVLSEVNSLGASHVFKNSAILAVCFQVFPRELVTCAIVFQLCRTNYDFGESPPFLWFAAISVAQTPLCKPFTAEKESGGKTLLRVDSQATTSRTFFDGRHFAWESYEKYSIGLPC